ncbi:MAG TPA: VPLPA-CTERM-specific exosortase XrtD [Burkholderiales bacterium]
MPVLLVLGLGLLWLMSQSGLVALWIKSEEYGHGVLVLLVLAYLIYRRRDLLQVDHPRHRWLGLATALLALIVSVVGATAGISQFEMYAVWLFAVAAVFAIGGTALFRKLLVPLLIVFMIIPLPNALEPALTAKLQLISSKLGVWFIRAFGGVVYLEGNVIDMGGTKLLVAEACAGLRYLYPLMSLGALAGYLMQTPVWMRWALFLSTIPITIFMNSFRIGVTGLLVENWGSSHTEGFLHFFEGWVVFVFATLALALFAWLLVKLQPGSHGFGDAFSFDAPTQHTASIFSSAGARTWQSVAVIGVAILIVMASVFTPLIASRTEIAPERQVLSRFPAQIEDWSSREYRLPVIVEQVAGASEYFYADYFSDAGTVNLYVSYYETQRNGQIPHSPKVCIPGDGWTIASNQPVTLRDKAGNTFEANRLVTTKGPRKILAYYWLKQGSRTYRQELLARLDLVRFSALERRTDGALIRLVTELGPDETEAAVDKRLGLFAEALSVVLPTYVPD